jgi:hypothetical protein
MGSSHFTQLAHLEPFMHDIKGTPREAVLKILAAPNLVSLTFEYTVESQHPEC